jgi:flagellar hook assembly protein FlgD
LIKDFRLFQNYPNPFKPSTVIGFNLPSESNVLLKIYNVLGEEVSTLINRRMNAGYHTVNFDAKDLMSGIYIYKLEAGNKSAIRKMIFQK